MKNRATEALLKIGLPMSFKGFHYIVRAMELYDKEGKNYKVMALYMQIAKENNTHYQNIERPIRYALGFITNKCPKEEVAKYFDLNCAKNAAQLACFYYRLCKEREMEEKVNE